MEFVLNGVRRKLEADTVTSRMHEVPPEPVREHAVRVGGVVYPVKQVFERASDVPRSQFTSQTALRHLRARGRHRRQHRPRADPGWAACPSHLHHVNWPPIRSGTSEHLRATRKPFDVFCVDPGRGRAQVGAACEDLGLTVGADLPRAVHGAAGYARTGAGRVAVGRKSPPTPAKLSRMLCVPPAGPVKHGNAVPAADTVEIVGRWDLPER